MNRRKFLISVGGASVALASTPWSAAQTAGSQPERAVEMGQTIAGKPEIEQSASLIGNLMP